MCLDAGAVPARASNGCVACVGCKLQRAQDGVSGNLSKYIKNKKQCLVQFFIIATGSAATINSTNRAKGARICKESSAVWLVVRGCWGARARALFYYLLYSTTGYRVSWYRLYTPRIITTRLVLRYGRPLSIAQCQLRFRTSQIARLPSSSSHQTGCTSRASIRRHLAKTRSRPTQLLDAKICFMIPPSTDSNRGCSAASSARQLPAFHSSCEPHVGHAAPGPGCQVVGSSTFSALSTPGACTAIKHTCLNVLRTPFGAARAT